MPVLVEQVEQAKTGRSLRVLLSGNWYGAYLNSGLNGMRGKMIEAEIKTLEKGGPWIAKWTECAAPQVQVPVPPTPVAPPIVPAAAAPPVDERRYAEPAPISTVAPWWMPFVSNTVAHAIASGHINTPVGIRAWVLAARDAAKAAAEGAKQTTENDPPF